MPNQSAIASRGAIASSGTIVRSAMLAASSRRTLIGCATWTTPLPVSVLNTRHSPTGVPTVTNPSCACAGNGCCGCDR